MKRSMIDLMLHDAVAAQKKFGQSRRKRIRRGKREGQESVYGQKAGSFETSRNSMLSLALRWCFD